MRRPDPRTPNPAASRRLRRRGGFTLIEAALTTVIVGTGVLAIVAAQQAFHQKNLWAQRTGTAMLLANELRELTISLPNHDPMWQDTHLGYEDDEAPLGTPDVNLFDDLDDFAGVVNASTGKGPGMTFNPPINALCQPIADMGRWSQHIMVERVWEDHINVPSGPLTPALDTHEDAVSGKRTVMRVIVSVRFQEPSGKQPTTVSTLSWIVPD